MNRRFDCTAARRRPRPRSRQQCRPRLCRVYTTTGNEWRWSSMMWTAADQRLPGAHDVDLVMAALRDVSAARVDIGPFPDVVDVLADDLAGPWASRGPRWLDPLLLLVNVNLFGGHDMDVLLNQHVPADRGEVTAMLAALTGYFLDAARRPAPAGSPTVRGLQAAQGARTLAWLKTLARG